MANAELNNVIALAIIQEYNILLAISYYIYESCYLFLPLLFKSWFEYYFSDINIFSLKTIK